MLKARCDVPLRDPQSVLVRLCRYYAEHGQTKWAGTRGTISIAYGSAVLDVSGGRLHIGIEAADETCLAYVKMGLVHHLKTFAEGEAPVVRWSGDRLAGVVLPFFREMTVAGAEDISPSMRRITLRGRDLDRFSRDGLHVRLIFPPAGREPVWPSLGEDGCPVWPDGEDALTARAYTMRRIDVERGEVAIDILRHDGDATPGSRFAATARPGDIVGMTGPGGGGLPAARSLVLLGDETAIPAIARILGALSAGAEAQAFIEVADSREEQEMPSAAAVRIEWLHRRGAAAGGRLPAVLEALDWRRLPAGTFVWAGCEFSDFKRIRQHLRGTRKMSRDEHLVVAYWRKGVAGDEARRGS